MIKLVNWFEIDRGKPQQQSIKQVMQPLPELQEVPDLQQGESIQDNLTDLIEINDSTRLKLSKDVLDFIIKQGTHGLTKQDILNEFHEYQSIDINILHNILEAHKSAQDIIEHRRGLFNAQGLKFSLIETNKLSDRNSLKECPIMPVKIIEIGNNELNLQNTKMESNEQPSNYKEYKAEELSDTVFSPKKTEQQQDKPDLTGEIVVVKNFRMFKIDTDKDKLLESLNKKARYWRLKTSICYDTDNQGEVTEFISGAKCFEDEEGGVGPVNLYYADGKTQACLLWREVARALKIDPDVLTTKYFYEFLNSEPRALIVSRVYPNPLTPDIPKKKNMIKEFILTPPASKPETEEHAQDESDEGLVPPIDIEEIDAKQFN